MVIPKEMIPAKSIFQKHQVYLIKLPKLWYMGDVLTKKSAHGQANLKKKFNTRKQSFN